MRTRLALLSLVLASSAHAADVTITVPEEKARAWMIMPALIEKCQQDVAFRGDINVCLYVRNVISEFSTKLKNELDAQATQEKK